MCCTNTVNVHCFGTIFPNLNFVFASICASRPVIFNPTNTEVSQLSNNDAQPKTAPWLWVREITWYLTPEECVDERRQNNTDFKLLENCVMTGFIIFGIMFITATGLGNSPQSFDVYPVSRSHSVLTSAENPAPDNSPQSSGELRNGHVDNLRELLYRTGSKNGVI